MDASRDTIEAAAGIEGNDLGANRRFLTLGGLSKFTALVALLAILSDAAIGHALLWENDPYWTYWITKTFLIATVFGLGTAWLGVGAARGAVITAIHTLILTIYYWSLSPIGLPSSPEWLDLEHTWVTGLPIHFGVIYLGYLAALWTWRRRPVEAADDRAVGRAIVVALSATVAIVAVAGIAEAVALGEFQGVTWYVVRILVTLPFLIAWRAVAGADKRAAVGGAIALTAVLTTYSHFLGPVGLPDLPLRIFETEAPGATSHWLSYRQEFLVAAPITLVVSLLVLYGLARREVTDSPPRRRSIRATGAIAAALAIAGAVIATVGIDPEGDQASIEANGSVNVERGSFYSNDMVPASGTLKLRTVERNPRVTPLRPHDVVDLTAEISTQDGTLAVRATQPMVSDPLGRFTTWWGVGYDRWHHGRSGIGTSLIPPVRSDVAVFALGSVSLQGRVLASGVPIHVMTMPEGVELDVGQPDAPIEGLPAGHIRAVWSDFAGGHGHAGANARYAYGALVMIALLVLVGSAIADENRLRA